MDYSLDHQQHRQETSQMWKDIDRNILYKVESGRKEQIRIDGSPPVGFSSHLTGRFDFDRRNDNIRKWGLSTITGSVHRPESLVQSVHYTPQNMKFSGYQQMARSLVKPFHNVKLQLKKDLSRRKNSLSSLKDLKESMDSPCEKSGTVVNR